MVIDGLTMTVLAVVDDGEYGRYGNDDDGDGGGGDGDNGEHNTHNEENKNVRQRLQTTIVRARTQIGRY